jgi:hypothetical protein
VPRYTQFYTKSAYCNVLIYFFLVVAAFDSAIDAMMALRSACNDPVVDDMSANDNRLQTLDTTVGDAADDQNDLSILHSCETNNDNNNNSNNSSNNNNNKLAAEKQWLAKVFDVGFARRSVQPFPPRVARRRGPMAARRLYTLVLQQCVDVLRAVWRVDKQTTTTTTTTTTSGDEPPLHVVLGQLRRATVALSDVMTRRRACVVSRALVVRQALPRDRLLGGRAPPVDAAIAGIAALWSTFDVGSYQLGSQIANAFHECDIFKVFLDLCGKVECNVVTFRANETTYQRQKLMHAANDYAVMQHRANELDEALNNAKFNVSQRRVVLTTAIRWLIDRTCDALALHAELGLMQSLHEPWELPMVMAQLMHCYDGRVINLKALRSFGGQVSQSRLRVCFGIYCDLLLIS